MSVTTGTFPGVRIVDMPDLGAVTDTSSMVGERAGSGRFAATALLDYTRAGMAAYVPTIAALRALASGAAAVIVQGYYAPGDGGGGIYSRATTAGTDNGGTVINSANGTYLLDTQGYPVSFKQFGAKGDGVTDNAPFLRTALAQSAFPGGALYFPPGIYNFASSVSFVYPPGSTPFSLTLQGAGADVTILNWTAQDGLVFAMSQPAHTIHMRDMSITCTSVGTSTGIRITQSAAQLSPQMQNDFSNVTFRGFDAANFTNYWATAVNITTLNETNFIGCDFLGGTVGTTFSGVGVTMQGASADQPCFVQNFVACSFSNMHQGVIYGDFLQGMTFSQCNFGGLAYAIHQAAGSGATFVGAELEITGSQFYATSVAINIEGTLDDISVTDSLIFNSFANTTGIALTPTSTVNRLTVTGCQFEGAVLAGIVAIACLGAAVSSVVIVGNVFFANHNCVYFPAGSNAVGVCITGNTMTAFAPGSTGGITLDGANSYFIITGNVFTNLGLAVKLGSGSSFCNVQSNVYYGCTGTTQDTGTTNVIGGGSP